jgi:hypothetical protein
VGYARERHHEPIGAAGLDAKESDWIEHQGHHILPGQPVGHLLLLFTEPGELQKLILWGRLLGPIQWSRWRWTRKWFNVDVGIFK